MGPLKTAGRSNEPFKNDLILAKCIKKKMNLAKIKSFLNSSLDRPAVLSGPMAFHPIYSHKYFHIFIFFIHQVIADFSKHAARAIATLLVPRFIRYPGFLRFTLCLLGGFPGFFDKGESLL